MFEPKPLQTPQEVRIQELMADIAQHEKLLELIAIIEQQRESEYCALTNVCNELGITEEELRGLCDMAMQSGIEITCNYFNSEGNPHWARKRADGEEGMNYWLRIHKVKFTPPKAEPTLINAQISDEEYQAVQTMREGQKTSGNSRTLGVTKFSINSESSSRTKPLTTVQQIRTHKFLRSFE